MEATPLVSGVVAAIVAGAVNVVGWWVLGRREAAARRETAELQHLRRQIEELYAPLLGLIRQSETIFSAIVLNTLPHDGGTLKLEQFDASHWAVWYVLYETR